MKSIVLFSFLPFALMGCGVDTDENAEADDVSNSEEAVTAGCSVTNSAPVYGNGRVASHTVLRCSSVKSTLIVKTWLSRNNVGVAEESHTCHNSKECGVLSYHDNSAGNQRWCTLGTGFVNHGNPISDAAACESKSF